MADVVLALDAGGSKLLGGLVDARGEVLASRRVPTPRVDGRCDPGLAGLRDLAGSLAAEAGAAGHTVAAVGVGVPEYVRDGVLTSAEVLAWDRQPAAVLADLPGLADVPVVVDADVRCAARAEAVARPATASFAYLSWGTGLSWTLVAGGRCVEGARGEALGLGEWPVDPRSGHAWPGTLEAFASGRGVQVRYQELTGRWLDGARIDALAAAGDAAAAGILGSAADAVAWAVRGLVQAVDPGLVVLGGGVSAAGGTLVRTVTARVPQLLARPGAPDVVLSLAGASAGLLGAARAGWDAVPAPGGA